MGLIKSLWLDIIFIFLLVDSQNSLFTIKNPNNNDPPLSSTYFTNTPTKLFCSEDQRRIYGPGVYGKKENHNFPTECPELYDYNHTLRSTSFMCITSKQNTVYKFEFDDIIITKKGGLISAKTFSKYTFDHFTMGNLDKNYSTNVQTIWSTYYSKRDTLKMSHGYEIQSNHYNLVVPLRMAWDNCWNHLSFQSIVLIGHVYEFYYEYWDQITWHASLFTAGLLQLLDIPPERIVIDKEIYAKKLILPWVRGWCPLRTASFKGIARNVSEIMTKNLLSLYSNNDTTINDMNSIIMNNNNESNKRYIIYMPRKSTQIRYNVNDKQIIDLLSQFIDHTKYILYILPHIDQHQSIASLHSTWYKYAKIFSKCYLMIGSHGASFNNMIWAPNDINIIEFNDLPENELQIIENKKMKKKFKITPVRLCFVYGAWAKGMTGKYYYIEPSMKNSNDLYIGKFRISLYELFSILIKLNNGTLLINEFNLNSLQPEIHSIWTNSIQAGSGGKRIKPENQENLENMLLS